MAQRPCYFCGFRFIGPAVTAYHRWQYGDTRAGYRQKACRSCAKIAWEGLLPHCVPMGGDDAVWPDTCKACGGSLSQDFQPSYHTFYIKKERTDFVAALCDACSAKIRPALMVGDDPLMDRMSSTWVEEGGAENSGVSILAALGRG